MQTYRTKILYFFQNLSLNMCKCNKSDKLNLLDAHIFYYRIFEIQNNNNPFSKTLKKVHNHSQNYCSQIPKGKNKKAVSFN